MGSSRDSKITLLTHKPEIQIKLALEFEFKPPYSALDPILGVPPPPHLGGTSLLLTCLPANLFAIHPVQSKT